MEYGIHGDLIIIYPKLYSISFRGNIWVRRVALRVNVEARRLYTECFGIGGFGVIKIRLDGFGGLGFIRPKTADEGWSSGL